MASLYIMYIFTYIIESFMMSTLFGLLLQVLMDDLVFLGSPMVLVGTLGISLPQLGYFIIQLVN